MNHNITAEELERLRNTKNETEWNDACDAIKKARNGDYPSDWWAKVMTSGLAAGVALKWNRPDAFEIKAELLGDDDQGNWIP